MRRLLIDYEALRESSMYCHTSFNTRSLLLRADFEPYEGMSYMLKSFKLLKVLDLKDISVSGKFPSAIEQLVLLAFLAIAGNMLVIPSWLANLSNLETLIILPLILPLADSLPKNLWNMQKLKYLYIKVCNGYGKTGGELPIDNLDDSPILYELDRFTGAIIDWCSMEKQLRKFPNIRKLVCLLTGLEADQGEYADKFVFPDFSSKLESLDMCGLRYDGSVRFEFASLTKLKKLKLSELNFDWEIFSIIGNQLPSLEVLKLNYLKFNDEVEYTWEMKSGEFSKLRCIRRWIACDDHEFNCFQKLVIRNCSELVELPSCLETIETLEEIEVSYCSEDIEDLVKEIESKRKYYCGNSDLKITWHTWRYG